MKKYGQTALHFFPNSLIMRIFLARQGMERITFVMEHTNLSKDGHGHRHFYFYTKFDYITW